MIEAKIKENEHFFLDFLRNYVCGPRRCISPVVLYFLYMCLKVSSLQIPSKLDIFLIAPPESHPQFHELREKMLTVGLLVYYHERKEGEGAFSPGLELDALVQSTLFCLPLSSARYFSRVFFFRG